MRKVFVLLLSKMTDEGKNKMKCMYCYIIQFQANFFNFFSVQVKADWAHRLWKLPAEKQTQDSQWPTARFTSVSIWWDICEYLLISYFYISTSLSTSLRPTSLTVFITYLHTCRHTPTSSAIVCELFKLLSPCHQGILQLYTTLNKPSTLGEWLSHLLGEAVIQCWHWLSKVRECVRTRWYLKVVGCL